MTKLIWYRERDPVTCQMSHIMYDGGQKVAVVRNNGKGARRFEVQIKQNSPWHRRKLESAKSDCEFVYLNTKR